MYTRKGSSFKGASVGFAIGAAVPLLWGTLGMLLFSVPEGRFSRIFWAAVYFTCPAWVIGGEKALVPMPLLNGIMCALLTLLGIAVYKAISVRNPKL
jgi:hypothetical protein